MSSYIIRKAGHADIAGLVQLLKILFSIEEDFAFDEEKQRRGLELMLQDNSNRCIFVAELEKQVVGMCSAQIMISTAEGGGAAVIEDVVVQQEHRGQGLGKELLLAVGKWAKEKGVKRLQLLADCNNTPALSFYDKMNWQKTALICLHKKEW